MKKKVTIRLDLEGSLADDFIYIKDRKGLKNNSEVVRALITEERQRVMGPK
jgi:hypothetical protein